MEKPESIAAPRTIVVPVKGGEHKLTISPWSMAQHDECFPIVAELIQYWADAQNPDAIAFSLGEMITTYKAEIIRLCKITIREQLEQQGLDWDTDLWGEDLFGIADAIWKTSLVRPGGGGVLGKAMGLMAPAIFAHIQNANRSDTSTPSESPPESSSPSPSTPTSSQPDSPSSVADGEPAPTASAMN